MEVSNDTGDTFSQCNFLNVVVGLYFTGADSARGMAPGGGGGTGPDPGGGATWLEQK